MSDPVDPSEFELSELMLCARYGDETDLDDIKTFVAKYGPSWLESARDARGNTMLHMAGGNGHADVFAYLLEHLPAAALVEPNTALSTPLHWLALNYHLPLLRLLCPLLPRPAFDLLNNHSRTAVQEAEEACENWNVEDETSVRGVERIRREETVGYLLGCMDLGTNKVEMEEDRVEKEEEDREKENGSATTTTTSSEELGEKVKKLHLTIVESVKAKKQEEEESSQS